MLALALRLGMTLHDLREQMSAEELMLWMAYDRLSPIGDIRGDIQTSIIAASTLQAQGAKVTTADMMPKWAPETVLPVDKEQEAIEGEALFRSFLLSKTDANGCSAQVGK